MSDTDKTKDLRQLLAEIRACKVCAANLPLGPRPIVRGEASARLLIVSQAPGKRVHQTGLSFDDKSGERLRCWLGLDHDTFYDEARAMTKPGSRSRRSASVIPVAARAATCRRDPNALLYGTRACALYCRPSN